MKNVSRWDILAAAPTGHVRVGPSYQVKVKTWARTSKTRDKIATDLIFCVFLSRGSRLPKYVSQNVRSISTSGRDLTCMRFIML